MSSSRRDQTARSGSWFGKLRSDLQAGLINAVVSVPDGKRQRGTRRRRRVAVSTRSDRTPEDGTGTSVRRQKMPRLFGLPSFFRPGGLWAWEGLPGLPDPWPLSRNSATRTPSSGSTAAGRRTQTRKGTTKDVPRPLRGLDPGTASLSAGRAVPGRGAGPAGGGGRPIRLPRRFGGPPVGGNGFGARMSHIPPP